MSIGAAIVPKSPRPQFAQSHKAALRELQLFTALIAMVSLAAWPTPKAHATPVPNTQASASFGISIAMDGDYAVVGAAMEDSPSTNAGAAYVYRYTGSQWVVDGRLLPNDPAASDNFGTSVAISGDTILVGSPGNDDTYSGSGSAYVFVRTINGWTQQAKLLASDPGASDSLGTSVTLDGDVAAIGSPYWEDGSSGSDAGAVYVFLRTGSSWKEDQILEAGDQAAGDAFGSAVDIDGTAILIGAPYKVISSDTVERPMFSDTAEAVGARKGHLRQATQAIVFRSAMP